jgi:hypothetical protein
MSFIRLKNKWAVYQVTHQKITKNQTVERGYSSNN